MRFPPKVLLTQIKGPYTPLFYHALAWDERGFFYMDDTDNSVIYTRYSSYSQNEQSIEGQLRDCYSFAEREGYTVIGTYTDRALTGRTDNRPDFQRMILDARKRQFKYVIVYKLDRFARNRYDSAVYKYKLRQCGVKVVSATEGISDNPEGIILEAVLEASAEYYSLELSQKIKRGQRESIMMLETNSKAIMKNCEAKIEELELQQVGLEIEISKLKVASGIRYTKEDILAWLKTFTNGDISDIDFRRRVINTFINSIYLYDTRVVIYYNIKDGKQVSHIEMIKSTDSLADNGSGATAPADKSALDSSPAGFGYQMVKCS